MKELINNLITNKISMVTQDRFETILRNNEYISQLEGDIVECGVWRGGMSIFLSKLFPNKKLWVCDSFEGFQPLETANYNFASEAHTPSYDPMIKVSLNEVQNNFKNYGFDLNSSNIEFLKGWVKDTLPTSNINKISLLRIDVDAYSATREVLDYLYNKVTPGGFIIFDDSCLVETVEAFNDFFEQNNIKFELRNTSTDEIIENPRQYGLPCGCYIIKK